MLRPIHWWWMLVLSALWGSTFLFLRISSPDAGVWLSTTARLGFAALFLGITASFLRQAGPWEQKKKMAMLALFNSAIPFGLFSYASLYLPAGYLSIINAAAPIMVLLVGIMFYHIQHSWRTWAGMVLGFGGVGALATLGPVTMGPLQWLAVVAGLLAALCYAVTSYWTVHWFSQTNVYKLAFQNQAYALLWLLPAYPLSPTPGSIGAPLDHPWWTWGSLAAAGMLCTGLGYLLYFKILKDIGAVKASSISFMIPCFALLWANLFLGEPVTFAHGLGIASIVVALRWLNHVPKVHTDYPAAAHIEASHP